MLNMGDISVNQITSSIVTTCGKLLNAGCINNKIQDYFKELQCKIKEIVSCEDNLYILSNTNVLYSYNFKTCCVNYIASDVQTIKGGTNHILFMNSVNQVFGMGDNSQYQLIPQGKCYYNQPIQIDPQDYVLYTSDCNNFYGILNSILLTDCNTCGNTCQPFTAVLSDVSTNITITGVTFSSGNCVVAEVSIPATITIPVLLTIQYSGCCSLNPTSAENINFQILTAFLVPDTYINAINGTYDLTIGSSLDVLSLISTSPITFPITACDSSYPLVFNLSNLSTVIFQQFGTAITVRIGFSITTLSSLGYSLESNVNTAITTTQLTPTIQPYQLILPCCDVTSPPCQIISTTFTAMSDISVTTLLYKGLPATVILPVTITGLIRGQCCSSGNGSVGYHISTIDVLPGTYNNVGVYNGGNFSVTVTNDLNLIPYILPQNLTISFTSCNIIPTAFPNMMVYLQCATFANSGNGVSISSTIITPTTNTLTITSPTGPNVPLGTFYVNPTIPCCSPAPAPPCTPSILTLSPLTTSVYNIGIGGLVYNGNQSASLFLPITISGTYLLSCCVNSDGYLFGKIIYNITSIVIPAGTYPTGGRFTAGGTFSVNVASDVNFSGTISNSPITRSIILDNLRCNELLNPTFVANLNIGLISSTVNSPLQLTINGTQYGLITSTDGNTLYSPTSPPSIPTDIAFAFLTTPLINCCTTSIVRTQQVVIQTPVKKCTTCKTVSAPLPITSWTNIYAGFTTSVLQDANNKLWVLGSLYKVRATKLNCPPSKVVTVLIGSTSTITIYNKKSVAKTMMSITSTSTITYDCKGYCINGIRIGLDQMIVINTGITSTCSNLNVFLDITECQRKMIFSYETLTSNVNFMLSCCSSFQSVLNYGCIDRKQVPINPPCDPYIINTYVQAGDIVNVIPVNLTNFVQAITPDIATVFNIGTPIIDVGVGCNNLTVITDTTIAIGNNDCGQLGVGDNITETCWRTLDINCFIRVFCSSTATFYISKDGCVYGCGNYERLIEVCGCDEKLVNSLFPAKIKAICNDWKICKIAVSDNHIVLMGTDIYGLGSNKVGQLGFNSCYDVFKFVKLKY